MFTQLFLNFLMCIIPEIDYNVKYNFRGYVKKYLDIVVRSKYNTPMKKYINKPWTDKERKHLAQYYHHASIEEMCDRLPDRTEQSIRNQVNYLKKRGIRFK
tara:strand:- start:1473 stop:1775 length:303 start_codon:yes stop_codon:yes gene_type:complete